MWHRYGAAVDFGPSDDLNFYCRGPLLAKAGSFPVGFGGSSKWPDFLIKAYFFDGTPAPLLWFRYLRKDIPITGAGFSARIYF